MTNQQSLSAKLNSVKEMINVNPVSSAAHIDILESIYFATYGSFPMISRVDKDGNMDHKLYPRMDYLLMAQRLLALHPELTDNLYGRYGKTLLIDRLRYYNTCLVHQDYTIDDVITSLQNLGY